jgi:DNA-directed RNA polymerase specialized sigma subunit
MTVTHVEDAEYYEQMNQVVEAMLKGETNPTTLARELGMTRKEVLNFMDEWRSIAANNPDIQARAREAMTAMDKHFDLIIKEMWAIVNGPADDKTRATVLKNIADVESKRQESLQKAGLYDDNSMAEEIAEMERKSEAIHLMFQEVAQKYPQTRAFIQERLSRIFGDSTVPSGESEDVLKGEIVN